MTSRRQSRGHGPTSPRGSAHSFDRSDRYDNDVDDLADQFFDADLHDRATSRAASSRSSFSNNSNSNKAYAYYRFIRGNGDWYNSRRSEINASQEEIRKKLRSKSKTEPALDQLKKMGEGRRRQILNLKADLNQDERDDTSWQPVLIENTKLTRSNQGELKPIEFNVIFTRHTQKPKPAQRRQSNAERPSIARVATSPAPVTQPKPKPIIHDSKKGKRSNSDTGLYSPFNKPVFTPEGQPMNENGPMPFLQTESPNIPQEKSFAQQMLPKINTQQGPAIGGGRIQPQIIDRNPLDVHALLEEEEIHGGDPDGIIDLGDAHHRSHSRHGSNGHQQRSRPGPKRYNSARRPSNSTRYGSPIIENRHPNQYTSSRSSFASDDGSVVWGEVDEVSSKTSDDTHYSGHRSPNKKSYDTNHRRQSGTYSPQNPRYRNGDAFAVPERKRNPTPTDNQRPYGYGFAQSSPNRNLVKPAIHQDVQRQSAPKIPPTAEYPSYYDVDRRRRDSYRQDEYLRDRQREEARQALDAEIAQRESDLRRQAREFNDRGNQGSRQQGNFITGGRQRYTFEPRDHV